MDWKDRTIADFLAAVQRPDPTPGGGSASALAGALGASLLAMVGALPKHQAPTPDDERTLRGAGRRCQAIAERLTALADDDSRAYDGVMTAYRLPKGSEGEKQARSQAIQDALRRATDVPLGVMWLGVDALNAARTVAAFGHGNASSDAGVGRELLRAAIRGAYLNVAINLDGLKDERYVAAVRAEAERLLAEAGPPETG